MRRIQGLLLSLLLVLLISPLPVMAAEVLRVRSSSLLQVGDHNRTYTVRLACLEVDPSNEAEAIAWLKSELPRRRRVNLRPEGASDGVLLARVTSIGNDVDLSAGLANAGLGRLTCDSAPS
ncbi:MAG: nuclease [Prochlorococcaceae cyanobacterium ETNP7_MAG_30]|nr:nuclease [Prochlorococcaceae cyanobacterium ETNP7_MAG_30]